MPHMIDPNAIPVNAIVGSFLKALAKRGVETCVVFRSGTNVAVASNRDGAEVMAKSVFAIQDGALEVAAIALHAYRTVVGAADGTDPNNTEPAMSLCSLVVCAGHELEHGGNPAKWDDLPEPIRDAHRAAAQAAVAAAVAHQAPQKEASNLIKPA